jgi:phosphatidate cytidylyltransferase
MLKQRVLTSLILAPLVITAVLLLPTDSLALLLALVVTVGAREWAVLSGINSWVGQLLYSLTLLLVMFAVFYLLPPTLYVWLVGFSVFWWVTVIFRLLRFQGNELTAASGFDPLRALEGVAVLVPAWLALIMLHRISSGGPVLLLFLLILIWSADVGAYFAGQLWGRHKLAPSVSPGKTREGVYGAMASALMCGLFLVWWLETEVARAPLLLLLCLITMLFSVIGDLFESLLKRKRGLKDSGTLLPGHGGMLDRIDSLTAAAPLFMLGLILFEVAA